MRHPGTKKSSVLLSVQTQWQVLTSNAALSGDVLFIRGARGRVLDVTVGKSYTDRGIRNGQHDFFGVTLSIPMCDKSLRGKKGGGSLGRSPASRSVSY